MLSTQWPPTDAIVVGAGISGLRTAELLQQAGLSCIVLEERDRIGGKILTANRALSTHRSVWSLSKQEYGAAWINDSTQKHVWDLVKTLKLTPIVQNSAGNVVSEDMNGELFQFTYGDAPEVSRKQLII